MRLLPVLLTVIVLRPLSAAIKCYSHGVTASGGKVEGFPLIETVVNCRSDYCITKTLPEGEEGTQIVRFCHLNEVEQVEADEDEDEGISIKEADLKAEGADFTCESEGCTTYAASGGKKCCCKGDLCNVAPAANTLKCYHYAVMEKGGSVVGYPSNKTEKDCPGAKYCFKATGTSPKHGLVDVMDCGQSEAQIKEYITTESKKNQALAKVLEEREHEEEHNELVRQYRENAIDASSCNSVGCTNMTLLGTTTTKCCCKADFCNESKATKKAKNPKSKKHSKRSKPLKRKGNPAATPTLLLLPLAAVAAMISARF